MSAAPALTVVEAQPSVGSDFLQPTQNGRFRFIAPRLARALTTNAPFAKGGEQLYRYLDGAYRPSGETWARKQITRALGDEWTRARADEVIAFLRDTAPALDERPELDVVNCRNGLLDIRTGRLQPHTPDLLTPVQIAARFDPSAPCPTFDTFLGQVLAQDAATVAIEIAGYLITPDNSLQRAFMFLGHGANGKSTITGVYAGLLGHENVASIPLHKIDEDRFAAASLYGRLANIYADLDARAMRSSSMFKSITGGDRIEAERKFRPAFTFTPYARLLFSANAVPPTTDSSDGYFRRWEILPFERRFDAGQRDPHLLDKLTAPTELSGLLNRALPALADLRARGNFSSSQTTQQANHDFRLQADSVAGFLEEACTTRPGAEVPMPDLARAYRDWCHTNGRGALSTARFNERLTALTPVEKVKVQGTRLWRGIEIETSHR